MLCPFCLGAALAPKDVTEVVLALGHPSGKWAHCLSYAGGCERVGIRKHRGGLVWGMTVVPHCCRLGPGGGGSQPTCLRGLVGGQWEGQSCPLQSILDGHPLGSKRNRWQLGRWRWAHASESSGPEYPHHRGFESPAGGRGEWVPS